MNKNLPLYIVCGVLLAAVVALFIMYGTLCSKSRGAANPAAAGDSSYIFPVAYVNMDTLLLNSDMYKKFSEELLKEEESARLNLNQKANALQAEIVDFQKKIENGIYATEQRARSEQERLQRKQVELQELEAKLAQDLMTKRDQKNALLKTALDSVIEIYNADGRYDFIFCNAADDNILYGKPVYNVTNEIVKMLNGDD